MNETSRNSWRDGVFEYSLIGAAAALVFFGILFALSGGKFMREFGSVAIGKQLFAILAFLGILVWLYLLALIPKPQKIRGPSFVAALHAAIPMILLVVSIGYSVEWAGDSAGASLRVTENFAMLIGFFFGLAISGSIFGWRRSATSHWTDP